VGVIPSYVRRHGRQHSKTTTRSSGRHISRAYRRRSLRERDVRLPVRGLSEMVPSARRAEPEANKEEIDRILRQQCARDFDGVFSVDTLPDRPRLVFCNTDPSYRRGCHWVAICAIDGRGEYFESFGRRPRTDFERYMNRHCRYRTFNDKQLQSVVSQFCGHYCICCFLYRSSGIDMRKIVCSFTSDTALNDVLVHALVCRIRK